MSTESNLRPISIFSCYMIVCVFLAGKCIHTSCQQSVPKGAQQRVVAFTILAIISLATTWYHMFRFFQWSYFDWISSTHHATSTIQSGDGLQLGDWLRQTRLFEQAWVCVLRTPEQAWWSMQIFGFCAILSAVIAIQCKLSDYLHFIFINNL